jgi:cytidine deaminase
MPEDSPADLVAELLDSARAVAANAYSPYSKFRVGCALVSASGARYVGCNVENASFGLTQCAERAAITAGVAAEGASFRIARIVVVVLAANTYFPPCGACRQVVAEFAMPDMWMHWPGPTGLVSVRMEQILPGAFQADALKI